MASLQSYSGKGNASRKVYYRIQPYLNGNRITLRLGTGKKRAIAAAQVIGDLIDSLNAGVEPSASSKQWLEETASKSICASLSKQGVISRLPDRFRGKSVSSISTLADEYVRSRCAGLESSTVVIHKKAKRNLIACFGDADITTLKPKDGREFWRWLQEDEGLAENTAKQRLRYARAFFEMGIEDELIASNPFKARGLSVTQTAAEKVYVQRKDVEKILSSCPNEEWRLLFTMARQVPLRIPSEIQEFTWNDIDFENNQILIHSPKTRRLGKSARIIPIFDSMRPLLHNLQAKQGNASRYVFSELRLNTNPSTTAKKIVKKAEVTVWKNFFNSLRASAETDLMDVFGIRKACQWAGNSVSTAMKNYALVKKSDYDESTLESDSGDAKSAAIIAGDAKSAAEPASKSSQRIAKKPIKNAFVQNQWENECVSMGDTGLEPVTPCL